MKPAASPRPAFRRVRARGRGWRRRRRIRRRAEALRRLVAGRLPAEHAVTGDHDAWPLIGAALLSRMTMTLAHIIHLMRYGQGVDAGTLVRSLYEHLLHFAWLAADPSAARIEEWRKDDLQRRLTADEDARQRGAKLFTDEERARLREQVASMTGDRLRFDRLAEAADEAWAGKLPATGLGSPSEPNSFRGLYAFVYRNYSGTAHPSYRGLNPVVQDLGPQRYRVVLEGGYEGRGPFGQATVIYALALYVAAASLGWPATTDVEAAFSRFPG